MPFKNVLGANANAANMQKGLGVRNDYPDLMLFFPANLGGLNAPVSPSFAGLAIEVKAGNDELSEDQRRVKAILESRGWKYATIRSLDEFKEAIQEYFRLETTGIDYTLRVRSLSREGDAIPLADTSAAHGASVGPDQHGDPSGKKRRSGKELLIVDMTAV
jgi:hypothetical protein